MAVVAVAGGIGPTGVPKSATSNGINGDEKNKHDDDENGELMPFPSRFLQNRRLARITTVTKHIHCVAPVVAVSILRRLANRFFPVVA